MGQNLLGDVNHHSNSYDSEEVLEVNDEEEHSRRRSSFGLDSSDKLLLVLQNDLQ